MRLLTAAAAVIALACCRLLSQEFEVASLKPARPNGPIGVWSWPGGRLTVTKLTLKMLIEQAYDVKEFQVSGGPRWIETDRFDIDAKPPASSESSKFMPKSSKERPTEEMLLMLRALLADRFELKIHRDSKEGTALALIVGAKGPKLEETKNKDDRPWVGGGSTDKPDRPEWMQGTNASMLNLATRLSRDLRIPVLDQTGLKGAYDFKFEYGPEDIYRTLQVELGLKLVSVKAPVETIVIDHVEKPSAN